MKGITEMLNTYNQMWLREREKLNKEFNAEIQYSTLYLRGQKVIPIEKIGSLKLGFRKKNKYVLYDVAFKKYCTKRGNL